MLNTNINQNSFLGSKIQYSVERGDFESAMGIIQTVIEHDCENAHAYFLRGNIKLKKEEIQSAIEDYNKAIELNPDNPIYYVSRVLAKIMVHSGQKEQIDDLDRAIALNPSLPEAHFLRGMIDYCVGFYESALQDFDIALKLGWCRGEIFYFKGLAMGKCNQFSPEDRIDAFKRAEDEGFRSPVLFFERALLKLCMGKTAGALDDAYRAIEIAPDFSEAYRLAMQIHIKYGEPDKARELADFMNLHREKKRKKRVPKKDLTKIP